MPVLTRQGSKFCEWVWSLSVEHRLEYSERVGVSDQSIRFWVPSTRMPPRRLPQQEEVYYRLADESEGKIERIDVLAHFFPQAFDGWDFT